MKRQAWLTGVACTAALQFACDASNETSASPGTAGASGTALDGGASARISRPGHYSGYSQPTYTGYTQTSQYVMTRDGTKLAMDLYRPNEANGQPTNKPSPVLWMHTPYNRRTYLGGIAAETYPGYALDLVQYGYVIALVDFRGTYASYGKNIADTRGEWAEAARFDAYDITEWLATQPWSNARIGMWGCSGSGSSQLQAASTKPPHLVAIIPMSCEFDAYSFGVQGGIAPPQGTPTTLAPENAAPAQRDATAMPVDADSGGAMLAEASAQHAQNADNLGYVPFRDSVATGITEPWWVISSPYNYLDALQGSNIATYLAANWDEAATKSGAFLTYNNLKTRRKLLVGPGKHCDWTGVKTQTGFDMVLEELRFFDYWLRDIDNAIGAEPEVYFYTYNAAPGSEWQSSVRWPLLMEQRTRYYLGERMLSTGMTADGKDQTLVSYDVTPTNIAFTGLIYDSPPLGAAMQVTGHPVAELWVSSTATDGDFVATLQDVAPDGTASSYNITGRLRASHRKLTQAPYNNLGLPWHRSNQEDVTPLVPNEPVQLVFEMLPISIVFQAGHQIRLALTFSSGSATPRLDPAPMVTIYRETARRSSISLPTVPVRAGSAL
jgi:predicted acyl esterase